MFQDNLNLFQFISQPFINGFCFNMGHLNELQLVIRMNKYSLGEVVIRIFEYSNHSLETLALALLQGSQSTQTSYRHSNWKE